MKKLYFIGAGSTSYLNIPNTQKQSEMLYNLCDNHLLNQSKEYDNLVVILKSFFSKSHFKIMDLYNLLDFCIINEMKLDINKEISIEDLKEVRKYVNRYIFNEFCYEIKKNGNEYKSLTNFYKKLANKTLANRIRNSSNLQNRDEFIADYSIINLNWDLYSSFPILEANAEINHENDNFLIMDNKNVQLRIYADFGCEKALKNGEDNDLWYPFTEEVANRINDPHFNSSRRALVVKTYFPHGLMNLFKCKSCGKHVIEFDALKVNYKDLNNFMENDLIGNCPCCGNKINRFDFDVLLQTNYKVKNSYFEEIKLNMINEIRRADEIVFLGYSLPQDDADYIAMFRFAKNNVKVKVVLKENECENKFISYEEAKNLFSNKEEIERYASVFGEDNVSFNFAGVPKCFECDEIY